MKNLFCCSLPVAIAFILFLSCNTRKLNKGSYSGSVNTSGYALDSLPAPFSTASSKNFSKVESWESRLPAAPPGFAVNAFAGGFNHPRWIFVAASGDVFVAESNTILKGIKKLGAHLSRKIKTQHIGTSLNHIVLLRGVDKNGMAQKRYLFKTGLNQPFGMLIMGHHFYIGNTDGLMEFDYNPGDTVLNGPGKKIVSLPAGEYNRHWTRNIITNDQQNKIFIGVGSGTNVAEKGLANEERRADILEVNPDGSGERIYASGLRNPVGMGWAPGTHTLWVAVNERDELGDELVPDYFTSVKENGFYGWPYSYFGQHEDPRMKDHPRPDLVSKAIVPDVPIGAHTASLGMLFYEGKSFPEKYRDGAFITQHGSWNRSVLSGYKVIFIPFKNGQPSGRPEDFLTGFIDDLTKSKVFGRPVGIALLPDGSLLVSDDVSNTIWRISYSG